MKWVVADTISHPEQFFCSHVDSYSWYLAQAGEEAHPRIIKHGHAARAFMNVPDALFEPSTPTDVLFMLDQYQLALESPARIKIAQTAAICNPMPWDVRKADGSPAYDLVISSIPWMVEQAREKGCAAAFMPLAFDTRSRVCGMGVKQRDIDCLFIGTVGGNHVRRTKLLEELRDVVTVLPPVWGRSYFQTLARAKVVISPHAEWARGAANNMRLYEAAGMGCKVVSDGKPTGSDQWWTRPGYGGWREAIECALRDFSDGWNDSTYQVLARHTYESRIVPLIELARSL